MIAEPGRDVPREPTRMFKRLVMIKTANIPIAQLDQRQRGIAKAVWALPFAYRQRGWFCPNSTLRGHACQVVPCTRGVQGAFSRYLVALLKSVQA
jgi:hypothetical protein